MVAIKVSDKTTDKILGIYAATSIVEARSILLVSGFTDVNTTWTRRETEEAEIIPFNPNIDTKRMWSIP
jgi:hypothetical protein